MRKGTVPHAPSGPPPASLDEAIGQDDQAVRIARWIMSQAATWEARFALIAGVYAQRGEGYEDLEAFTARITGTAEWRTDGRLEAPWEAALPGLSGHLSNALVKLVGERASLAQVASLSRETLARARYVGDGGADLLNRALLTYGVCLRSGKAP